MAISDNAPPAQFGRGGKIIVTTNVTQKQVTDPLTGGTRTVYEYDEAEGGDTTEARRNADAKAALKLAAITDMTYAELDAWIDANVTTLATSKAFMKRLAKVVLALVKENSSG